MNRTSGGLLVAVVLLQAACVEPEHPRTAGPEGAAHDASHAAGHADAAEGAELRPIMQHLGASMAGLQEAIWLEDYELMALHAGAVSGHIHISEAELARIRGELGEEMGAFERSDSTVHEAALRLRSAVGARDMEVVLRELAEVQAGCVACHTAFRARLRTDSLGR